MATKIPEESRSEDTASAATPSVPHQDANVLNSDSEANNINVKGNSAGKKESDDKGSELQSKKDETSVACTESQEDASEKDPPTSGSNLPKEDVDGNMNESKGDSPVIGECDKTKEDEDAEQSRNDEDDNKDKKKDDSPVGFECDKTKKDGNEDAEESKNDTPTGEGIITKTHEGEDNSKNDVNELSSEKEPLGSKKDPEQNDSSTDVIQPRMLRRSSRIQSSRKVCDKCSTVYKDGWEKCEVCAAIDEVCESDDSDDSDSGDDVDCNEVNDSDPEIVFVNKRKSLVSASKEAKKKQSKKGQQAGNNGGDDSQDSDVVCITSSSEIPKQNQEGNSISNNMTNSSQRSKGIRKVDLVNDKFPSVMFCDACNTGYAHPIDFQCHYKILDCKGLVIPKALPPVSGREKGGEGQEEDSNGGSVSKVEDDNGESSKVCRQLTPHYPSYSDFCRLIPYDPRADTRNWGKKKINRVQRCFKCNMFFPSLDEFMIHLNGDDEKLKEVYGSNDCLNCSWCDHSAKSLCRMQQHRFLMHRMEYCNVCDKLLPSKEDLNKHMLEHPQESIKSGKDTVARQPYRIDNDAKSQEFRRDLTAALGGSAPKTLEDLDNLKTGLPSIHLTKLNSNDLPSAETSDDPSQDDAESSKKDRSSCSQKGFVEVIGGKYSSTSTKLLKRKAKKGHLGKFGKRGLYVCKMCDAMCHTDIALMNHKKEFHPVVYKLEQMDVKYGPSWRANASQFLKDKKKKKKKKKKHDDKEMDPPTQGDQPASNAEEPVSIGSIGNQVIKIADTFPKQGVPGPKIINEPANGTSQVDTTSEDQSAVPASSEMTPCNKDNEGSKSEEAAIPSTDVQSQGEDDDNKEKVIPEKDTSCLPPKVLAEGEKSQEARVVNGECKEDKTSTPVGSDIPSTSTGGVTQSGPAAQGVSLVAAGKIPSGKKYYKNPVRGRPRREVILEDDDITSSDETEESDCSWLDQSSDDEDNDDENNENNEEDVLEPGEIRVPEDDVNDSGRNGDADVIHEEKTASQVVRPAPNITTPPVSQNTTPTQGTPQVASTQQDTSGAGIMSGLPGNVLQLSNLLRTFHMVDVSELYQVAAQLIDPKDPGEAPKDEAMRFDREEKFLYKIPFGYSHPEFEQQALFPSSKEIWYRSHKYKYSPLRLLSAKELEKKYKRTVPKYISDVFSRCLDDAVLTHSDKLLRGISLNVRRKKAEDRKELTQRLVKYIVSRYYAKHPQEGTVLKGEGGSAIKIQGMSASMVISPKKPTFQSQSAASSKLFARPNPLKPLVPNTSHAANKTSPSMTKSAPNADTDSPISRFATMSSIRVRRFEMNHLSLSDTIGRIQHIQKFMANGTLPSKVKEKIAPLCNEICDPTVPLSQKVRNVRTMEVLFAQDCTEQWNSYRISANLPKMGSGAPSTNGKEKTQDDSCEEISDDEVVEEKEVASKKDGDKMVDENKEEADSCEEVIEDEGNDKNKPKDEMVKEKTERKENIEKSDSCEVVEGDHEESRDASSAEAGAKDQDEKTDTTEDKDKTEGNKMVDENKEKSDSCEEIIEDEGNDENKPEDQMVKEKTENKENIVKSDSCEVVEDDHEESRDASSVEASAKDLDEKTDTTEDKDKTDGDKKVGENTENKEKSDSCEEVIEDKENDEDKPGDQMVKEKTESKENIEKSVDSCEVVEGDHEESRDASSAEASAKDQDEKTTEDKDKTKDAASKEVVEDGEDDNRPGNDNINKSTKIDKPCEEMSQEDEVSQKTVMQLQEVEALDEMKKKTNQNDDICKELPKVDEDEAVLNGEKNKDEATRQVGVPEEEEEKHDDDIDKDLSEADEDKDKNQEKADKVENKDTACSDVSDSGKDQEDDGKKSAITDEVKEKERIKDKENYSLEELSSNDVDSKKPTNEGDEVKNELQKMEAKTAHGGGVPEIEEALPSSSSLKTSGERLKSDIEEPKESLHPDDNEDNETEKTTSEQNKHKSCMAVEIERRPDIEEKMDTDENQEVQPDAKCSDEVTDVKDKENEAEPDDKEELNSKSAVSDSKEPISGEVKQADKPTNTHLEESSLSPHTDSNTVAANSEGISENKDGDPSIDNIPQESKDSSVEKLQGSINKSEPPTEIGNHREPDTKVETPVEKLQEKADNAQVDTSGEKEQQKNSNEKVDNTEVGTSGGSVLRKKLEEKIDGTKLGTSEHVQQKSEHAKQEIPVWTIPTDDSSSSESESSLSSDSSFQRLVLESIHRQQKIKQAQQAQKLMREMQKAKKKEMEQQKIREALSMKAWYEHLPGYNKLKEQKVQEEKDKKEKEEKKEEKKDEKEEKKEEKKAEEEEEGKDSEEDEEEDNSPKHKFDARERRQLEIKRKRAIAKKRKLEELRKLADFERKREQQLKQRALVVERLRKGYRASPRLVAQNISEVKEPDEEASEDESDYGGGRNRKSGRQTTRSGRKIPNYAERDDHASKIGTAPTRSARRRRGRRSEPASDSTDSEDERKARTRRRTYKRQRSSTEDISESDSEEENRGKKQRQPFKRAKSTAKGKPRRNSSKKEDSSERESEDDSSSEEEEKSKKGGKKRMQDKKAKSAAKTKQEESSVDEVISSSEEETTQKRGKKTAGSKKAKQPSKSKKEESSEDESESSSEEDEKSKKGGKQTVQSKKKQPAMTKSKKDETSEDESDSSSEEDEKSKKGGKKTVQSKKKQPAKTKSKKEETSEDESDSSSEEDEKSKKGGKKTLQSKKKKPAKTKSKKEETSEDESASSEEDEQSKKGGKKTVQSKKKQPSMTKSKKEETSEDESDSSSEEDEKSKKGGKKTVQSKKKQPAKTKSKKEETSEDESASSSEEDEQSKKGGKKTVQSKKKQPAKTKSKKEETSEDESDSSSEEDEKSKKGKKTPQIKKTKQVQARRGSSKKESSEDVSESSSEEDETPKKGGKKTVQSKKTTQTAKTKSKKEESSEDESDSSSEDQKPKKGGKKTPQIKQTKQTGKSKSKKEESSEEESQSSSEEEDKSKKGGKKTQQGKKTKQAAKTKSKKGESSEEKSGSSTEEEEKPKKGTKKIPPSKNTKQIAKTKSKKKVSSEDESESSSEEDEKAKKGGKKMVQGKKTKQIAKAKSKRVASSEEESESSSEDDKKSKKGGKKMAQSKKTKQSAESKTTGKSSKARGKDAADVQELSEDNEVQIIPRKKAGSAKQPTKSKPTGKAKKTTVSSESGSDAAEGEKQGKSTSQKSPTKSKKMTPSAKPGNKGTKRKNRTTSSEDTSSTSGDDRSASKKTTDAVSNKKTPTPTSTKTKPDKNKQGKSGTSNGPVKNGPSKKRQRNKSSSAESDSDTGVINRTSGSNKGKQSKQNSTKDKVSPGTAKNRKRPHSPARSSGSEDSEVVFVTLPKKATKEKTDSSTKASSSGRTRRSCMLSQLGLTEKEIREMVQAPRRGNRR